MSVPYSGLPPRNPKVNRCRAGLAGLFSFGQTGFVKTTLPLISLGTKFSHDILLCHVTRLRVALNYLLILCLLSTL